MAGVAITITQTGRIYLYAGAQFLTPEEAEELGKRLIGKASEAFLASRPNLKAALEAVKKEVPVETV